MTRSLNVITPVINQSLNLYHTSESLFCWTKNRTRRHARRSFFKSMARKHDIDPSMANHTIREKLQLKGVLKSNPMWLYQKKYEMSLTKEDRDEIKQKRDALAGELKTLENSYFIRHLQKREEQEK